MPKPGDQSYLDNWSPEKVSFFNMYSPKENPFKESEPINDKRVDELVEKVDNLEAKMDRILKKLDYIFGNHVAMNGRLIDVDELVRVGDPKQVVTEC